ncbi:MAG TPA: hypothetical protein PK736_03745 [Bacteroidia bacterium]|nr:hypothetical protein [Bacteroidia bacterium]
MDATMYIKEYKTEKPIPYATVNIVRGLNSPQIIKTVTTDENGKAIYCDDVDADYDYYFEAVADNYVDVFQIVPLRNGVRNYEATLYKYASSYVKLHIINVNPFNQYDLLQFSTACSNFIQGANVDTVFLFCDNGNEFMGNFELYNYHCIANKNGIDSTIYFSFIPPPHDTVTININY